MITYAGVKTVLWGTKTGLFVTVIAAGIFGGWVYGQAKYWQGGVEREVAIVKKSNKKAQRRDKRIGKKVNRIKPGSVRDRMRKAYSRPVER